MRARSKQRAWSAEQGLRPMASAQRSAEEARQSALELINRYSAGENGTVSSSKLASDRDKAKNSTPAQNKFATPGFEVLNLQSATGEFQEIDADEYRDLRDFVSNRTLRGVDKVFAERAQRAKELSADAGALPIKGLENGSTGGADFQSLANVPPATKKLLIKGLQQHKLNLQRAKEISERNSGRSKDTGNASARTARSQELAPDPLSPREPHSPRKSPPTILSPGHYNLIAWKGVPPELRKAFFDPQDGENDEILRNNQQEAEPITALESREEQLDRVNEYLASKPSTRQHNSNQNGNINVSKETSSMAHTRDSNGPESENIQDAVGKSTNQASSKGASSAARHRAWLEQRAVAHHREQRRVLARNKTSQAIPTTHIVNKHAPKRNVHVSNLLRNSSSCSKLTGYSELCRRARQQVLDERKRQLEDLAKRRDAARVLQRALRAYMNRRQTLREVAEKRAQVARKEAKHASKLQAIFRGHAARVGVQAIILQRTRAACKLQRLVRESRSWRRLQRERNHELRLQQEVDREEAAAESDAEREHYEWVHRVLNRAQKEALEETRISMLSSTPENVRKWIMNAPKVGTLSTEEANSGRELVLHAGYGKESMSSAETVVQNDRCGSGRARLAAGANAQAKVPQLRLDTLDNPAERTQYKQRFESARKHANVPIASSSTADTQICSTSARMPSEVAEGKLASSADVPPSVTANRGPKKELGSASKSPSAVFNEHAQKGGKLSGEEYAAMNTQIETELSKRVVNVHGRVDRLRRTMNTISSHEQSVPALRFSGANGKGSHNERE